MEMVFKNYYLIKIVTAVFVNVAILCFGPPLKGPYIWK
jgi:hypothetical protein